MANTRNGNVLYIDTTGYTLSGPVSIKSIKYAGNTSGTAVLTANTSGSGNRLWEEAGANNQAVDELCIKCADGIHVAITNGARVYIYLE